MPAPIPRAPASIADAYTDALAALEASGGLLATFQSGAGTPVGAVTPVAVGAIYLDVSEPSTGLWTAYGAGSSNWVALNGTTVNGVTIFAHAGTPAAAVTALAIGDLCADITNGVLYQATATGTGNWVKLDAGTVTAVNGTTVFANAGTPASTVSALRIGDLCVDTTNGLLYQATATGTGNWVLLAAGTVAIAAGGTGAVTVAGALTNLGTIASAAAAVTVAQTIGATTAVPITALVLPVAANQVYQLEAELFVNNVGTSATAVGVALTVPANATIQYDVLGQTNSATQKQIGVITASTLQTGFITTSGFTGFLKINGAIAVSSTSGNVQIAVNCIGTASNSTAAATVGVGSFLLISQV